VKISIISRSVPLEDGSAPGKAFWALGEGLIAEGAEVAGATWQPEEPSTRLPSWCGWFPPHEEPWLKTRARAIIHPRSDSLRTSWHPDPDAVAVAHDVESFASVADARMSVVVFHYNNSLDRRTRRRNLADVQWARAERRAVEGAKLVLAYSDRVAAACGPDARAIPIAYPIPDEPAAHVAEPVAGMVADWRWPPNKGTLDRLRRMWPTVRARVPAARLLLAGVGLDDLVVPEGAEVLGRVPNVRRFWDRVAVLVFPVPTSSGPKIKVLESMAYGVPVVTTKAGVEGLGDPQGALVSNDSDAFVEHLVTLLIDEGARRKLGSAGRVSVADAHSPRTVARIFLSRLESAFRLR